MRTGADGSRGRKRAPRLLVTYKLACTMAAEIARACARAGANAAQRVRSSRPGAECCGRCTKRRQCKRGKPSERTAAERFSRGAHWGALSIQLAMPPAAHERRAVWGVCRIRARRSTAQQKGAAVGRAAASMRDVPRCSAPRRSAPRRPHPRTRCEAAARTGPGEQQRTHLQDPGTRALLELTHTQKHRAGVAVRFRPVASTDAGLTREFGACGRGGTGLR